MLLSRFQGGLLGGQIGQALWSQTTAEGLPWVVLQDCVLASLIQTGQFSLQDWLDRIKQRDASLLQQQHQGNSAEVALALFPVCLFYHENLPRLREMLVQGATFWLGPQDSLDFLLGWGEGIARSLEMPNHPSALGESFSPQRDFLRNYKGKGFDLQQIQKPGKGLVQVIREVSPHLNSGDAAIALALYCFSSTPDHFSLCLQRAANTDAYAPLTTPLTGTIAGTYNGVHSLSLVRRHSLESSVTLQAARQLFQVWSGVYTPTEDLSLHPAIAGSGQLQPRPSLSLISHPS
ncbi:hypothetical protein PN462_14550 [Spirulina sp. CS-785/01]|uniref:hypothetical protein n=1 Tax=Spirulina sp. CS-785/01 TaxID=3021716 RepID=UPI00232CF5E7|nr:hypothetical protein [Spirulina sp. CS-785/01]MDB9314331.1 hypothetical protein [Spirulina sp. CS-785/01]